MRPDLTINYFQSCNLQHLGSKDIKFNYYSSFICNLTICTDLDTSSSVLNNSFSDKNLCIEMSFVAPNQLHVDL